MEHAFEKNAEAVFPWIVVLCLQMKTFMQEGTLAVCQRSLWKSFSI
jgi:hypothetical protein